MLDPISDMLTRIRNAMRAGHATVTMPSSKMKVQIAEILKAEGYIDSVEVTEDGAKKTLSLTLKYTQTDRTTQEPAIRQLNRVSREGQRVYVRAKDIRTVKNGYGMNIISTSQGVMTGAEARKKRLGGEMICELW